MKTKSNMTDKEKKDLVTKMFEDNGVEVVDVTHCDKDGEGVFSHAWSEGITTCSRCGKSRVTTTKPNNEWEKEFHLQRECQEWILSGEDGKEIKAFIQQLLDEQNLQWREWIEKELIGSDKKWKGLTLVKDIKRVANNKLRQHQRELLVKKEK